MIRIVEPTAGQRLTIGQVVNIKWTTDEEYSLYALYYRTENDVFWQLIADNIPGELNEYPFVVPATTGQLYFKIIGFKGTSTTFIGVAFSNGVRVYRFSDNRIQREYSSIPAQRIKILSGLEVGARLEDDRYCITSPDFSKVYLPVHRVMDDVISGEELKVMQKYILEDVQNFGSGLLLTEHTDNRFVNLYTDSDGTFSTERVFTCGKVCITAGLELGNKSESSWYWDNRYAINLQNLTHPVSGITAEVEILHGDVSGIELVIPRSNIFKKTLIRVLAITEYGDALSGINISPYSLQTDENGVLEVEEYYTGSSVSLYASSDEYVFRPTTRTVQLEGQSVEEVVFIGERVYNLSVNILQQYNRFIDFPVQVCVQNTDTGEIAYYSTSNGKTSCKVVRGTYKVWVERKNMDFHPTYMIIKVEEDSSWIFTCNTYKISGQVYDDIGGVSGISINVDGKTATTDAQGGYTVSGLPPDEYTIVPFDTFKVGNKQYRRYFSPSSRTVMVKGDVSNQDFYVLRTYTAIGSVNIHSVYPAEDSYEFALLTDSPQLFGGLSEITLNGKRYQDYGWYSVGMFDTSGTELVIENLPPARYALVPVKQIENDPTWHNKGWIIEPEEVVFKIENSDVSGIIFDAYSGYISGKVVGSGLDLSGISIELIGGEHDYAWLETRWEIQPKITYTAADGSFAFPYQVPGQYTVYALTTQIKQYEYSPKSYSVEITKSNLDIENVEFTASLPPRYTISGTVKDKNNNPILNEKVYAVGYKDERSILKSDVAKITYSGLSPDYSIQVPQDTGYAVYVSSNYWDYSPKRYVIDVLNDVSGLDFVGYHYYPEGNRPDYAKTYKITGTILDIFNKPAAGVVIKAGNCFGTTNESGVYVVEGLAVGVYSVYPSVLDIEEIQRVDYTFADDCVKTVDISNQDVSGIDFVAVPKYKISGRVIDESGIGLEDISVLFNQHHSRVLEVDWNSGIMWSYDKDLFEPTSVQYDGQNITITNRGKNNIVILDKNKNLSKILGSELSGNGSPGEPSGIGLFTCPTWADYRNGVFYISDTGNNRFLIMKDGEIMYLKKFTDGNILEARAVPDDLVGMFSAYENSNNLDFYSYSTGNKTRFDGFSENIKAFDGRSFPIKITDFSEGINETKYMIGYLTAYEESSEYENTVENTFTQLVSWVGTENESGIISTLEQMKEAVSTTVESWTEEITKDLDEDIQKLLESYTSSYMQRLLENISVQVKSDFNSVLNNFSTILQNVYSEIIDNFSDAPTDEEKKKALSDGMKQVLEEINTLLDKLLYHSSGAGWNKVLSALIECVLGITDGFREFIETFLHSTTEQWSLLNFKQRCITLLDNYLATGKITQEQYDLSVFWLERCVSSIEEYSMSLQSQYSQHYLQLLIDIFEKLQELMTKIEEDLITTGLDENTNNMLIEEFRTWIESVISTENQFVSSQSTTTVDYIITQLQEFEMLIEQYDLEELVQMVDDYISEIRTRLGVGFSMLSSGVEKCIRTHIWDILNLLYWDGSIVGMCVYVVSGYIVELNRKRIVITPDNPYNIVLD